MVLLALLAAQVAAPSVFDAVLDDPKLTGSIVAAVVADAQGNPIYERNAGLRVMPASNQKLLTCAFALNEFGPDYLPETGIWIFGDRTMIQSGGDPSLTFSQLKAAAKEIDRRKPLDLVQAYGPMIGPSWEHDDLPNRYAAQVSAFGFDQAAFALWAVDKKPVLLPDDFGVRVRWESKTGRVSVKYDPFRRVVQVSGAMPAARTKLDTLSLPSPDLDAASLFSRAVRRRGLKPMAVPPSRKIIGAPMAIQIADCLKPSDNLRAENLLMMAAARKGPLGSEPYRVAAKRLKDFLVGSVGIAPMDVDPSDGSGLSRHNVLTARALCRLLAWANAQPTSEVWRAALASPGKSGTLRLRLTGVELAGKTGSLTMVASLSGYLKTKSGEDRIVSVVLNHFACTLDEARAIIDRFVLAARDL